MPTASARFSTPSPLVLVSLIAGGALLPGCFWKSSETGGSGSPGTTPQNPVPGGVALYLDMDLDGQAGAGDEVHLRFDRTLALNGATIEDLVLAVDGDDFGAGAALALDGDTRILRASLGADPSLKARRAFDPFELTTASPTGVNVAASDRIQDAETGGDVAPAPFPLDLVPGFVEGSALSSAAGERADHLVLTDLDRDGRLDVVRAITGQSVAGTPGGSSSVLEAWLGDGLGSFALAQQLDVEGLVTALGLGDIDRDGDQDLLLGRVGPDAVYRVDSTEPGSATLAPGFLLDLAGTTTTILGLDANRDGWVDVVAGDENGLHVHSSIITGFDVPESYLGAPVLDVAAGDVDRDGFQDLFLGLEGPDRLLRGSKNGFEILLTTAEDSLTRAVDLVDLDRDGDLDYIAAKDGVDRVGLGEGNGFFFESDLGEDARRTDGLALADVDGDGRVDLVRTQNDPLAGGVVATLTRGDGSGSFDGLAQELPAAGARGLAVGDVDLDGDPDLVMTGLSARVWHGSLSGVWGDYLPEEDLGVDLGSGSSEVIASGDLNGDGLPDLAVGGLEQVVLLPAVPGGGYGEPMTLEFPGTRAQDIVFSDLDRDGDQDMVVGLLGGGLSLWVNDGAGALEEAPILLPEVPDVTAIAAADVTGDGFADLILGRSRTRPDKVLLNLGVSVVVPTGTDGPPDTIAPCVWLGFADSGQEFSSEYSRDVVAGDLDGDGDLDLYFAHQNTISDEVYENVTGLGFFELVPQVLNTGNSRDLALTDLDSDGDLDVFVSGFGPDQVWTNDGQGGLIEGQVFEFDDSEACDARDLNGDGRVDLVSAGAFGVKIRFQQPDGAYLATPDLQFDSLEVQDIELAELVRDGTLQLLVGARAAGVANLLLRSR